MRSKSTYAEDHKVKTQSTKDRARNSEMILFENAQQKMVAKKKKQKLKKQKEKI